MSGSWGGIEASVAGVGLGRELELFGGVVGVEIGYAGFQRSAATIRDDIVVGQVVAEGLGGV